MQNLSGELDLQFFAEGASAGDGQGNGAPAGVGADSAAADAGQRDVLETMGVPSAEIRKYRAIAEKRGKQPSIQPAQDAAAEEPQEKATVEQAQPAAKKSLKDALKDDPEWNREMQGLVSERVKKTNARLDKALQILEIVGRDYGIETDDLANLDLDALSEKVEGDKRRYENAALAHGTDVDTEMRLEKLQRENRQQKKILDDNKREADLRNHYQDLQRQAAELKKVFPDFDLEAELQNREFYERTLPGSKDTVKTAYFAIHGEEIATKRARQAAQAAAGGAREAIANNIRAGQRMPAENGTVQRAPGTVQSTPYSKMTPEQRKEFERGIKAGRYFA